MRGLTSVTRLLVSIAIVFALSFVSWFIGGEPLRVLAESILSFGEPAGVFIAYALTGLLIGAVNGLVLYRLIKAWFVLLVGAAAGWGLAFALIMFSGPIVSILGWATGLAVFAAILVGFVRLLGGGGVKIPPPMPSQIDRETAQTPQPPQTIESKPMVKVQETPAPTLTETGSTPPPTQATTPSPQTETEMTPPPTATQTETAPPTPMAIPPPPPEPSLSIEDLEETLVEIMVEEEITEIVPLPNNTSPEGGSYPDLESRLGIDTTTLLKVIKRLIDKNIVKVSGVEFKKVMCPHCQSALNILTLSCRACGSTNIGRQRILQHEACGYLGPEDSFTTGGRPLCPRCGSSVKILRGPIEDEQEQVLKVHSSFFMCYDCNEVSPDPYISFRCLTCGLDYDLSSFEFKTFYKYAINPEMISELQRQKRPLKLIAEELKKQGYEVQLGARILGSSKVRHNIDLLYSRLGQVRGAVFLFSDKGGAKIHEIMKIIVMKADTRIDNIKILCLGQLDNDSKRLAELYNIVVMENLATKDLGTEVVPRLI
ncbi:MAG: hypothetical protein QW082_05285 [Nitrososphaerota archaeon]